MPDNQITDQDIKNIQKAFRSFSVQENITHEKMLKNVIEDKSTGLSTKEKNIGSRTLQRWLLPDKFSEKKRFTEAEKRLFIKYIVAQLNSTGKTYRISDGIPVIANEEFERDLESYFFYYWNGYNHITEGEIILSDKVKNVTDIDQENEHAIYRGIVTATLKGTRPVKLEGFFYEDNRLINIRLKRNNSHGIRSHITFKKSTSEKDVYIGTYCTSTTSADNKLPKSGLIVLIKKSSRNNVDFSLIEYILYEKRMLVKDTGFDIDKIDLNNENLPPAVRNWAIIKKFKGYYEAFFVHAKELRLNQGIIEIQENGKVTIIFEKDIENPYKGFITKGFSSANQITINADFDSLAMDYRVKIYLEAGRDDIMIGIYTCFLSKGDSPHASKFVMKKIDIKVEEINKRVETINLKSKADLVKSLKAKNILKYFVDKKEDVFNAFAFYTSR